MKLQAKHFGKDRFYTPTYSAQQMGIYKLLIKGRGIVPEIVCECLDEYREKYMSEWFNRDTMSNREKKYYTERRIKHAVIEHCSGENFGNLLKIITEKTGQIFKTKYKKQRRNSYDAWYAEACMDGSLAFEGVADSF